MKKIISVVALASLFAAGSAMASGYRIPEQSLNSTAKAGANIASASTADAAYFNPAAMGSLADTWNVEGTATYLHLTSIDYDDDRSSAFDGSSEKENFFLPTMFVVSPDYNNFRFGFYMGGTYGLQKRWYDDPYPKANAEKFSLKVIEFNPTMSYTFGDMFSIGGGVRLLYNEATVMKDGGTQNLWMNDDTTEWGYNLAADFKPNDSWNFALTYRSKIDLDFDDGDVRLGVTAGPYAGDYSGKGATSVPAPAVLSFSTAYTYDQWTFDLTLDRTFWSKYEELAFDFTFPTMIAPPDTTYAKEWDDTTCVRLGAEYRINPKITLMGGIAYDENPVPEDNLSFELPDSDAWLFSLGVRYKQSEQLEYGVAVLYDYKEKRDVENNTGIYGIDGEFSNASAILLSVGMSYKF